MGQLGRHHQTASVGITEKDGILHPFIPATIVIDGEDIQRLIFNKLGPACEGEQLSHAVLGMLTLTVLLLKPQVDIAQLQECVKGTSEYMMMVLSEPVGEVN